MRGRHQVDPRSEKKKKYDALHKAIPMDSKDGSSASNSMDGSQQYFNWKFFTSKFLGSKSLVFMLKDQRLFV